MANLNFAIKLGLAAEGLKSGLSQAQASLKGFASSVKSCMGMIAGAFAAGQIKSFASECVSAYSAQMQAEQKLSVIMKQRMNASDAEVKSILKLTAAQQKQGIIGDEVQLAGAQQVSTFLHQKESLNQLIPAMNNLLAQQKGVNATQGDAVNIGNLMGKALQGQVGALKRVGISFDEAQANVLKYGTESERAAMLAQVITDNVGNMNSALAQTDMGKIQQMNNILGDLKEKIGGAIAPIVADLAPSLTNVAVSMANGITSAIDTIKNNVSTFVEFVVAAFSAIKLTPLIQSWLAEAGAAETQAMAKVQQATAFKERAEDALYKYKQQLAVLEVKLEESTGSQKLAIANQIANKKAAIAKQETTVKEAELAVQEAQTKAAAAAETTTWGVAWTSIKNAGMLCWTSIKAAMVSTGIGALIMVVVAGVMKLVEWFTQLKSVQEVWSGVCAGLKSAWQWCTNLVSKCVEWAGSFKIIQVAVTALLGPIMAVYRAVVGIINKIRQAGNEAAAAKEAASEGAHNKLEALRKKYKQGSYSPSASSESSINTPSISTPKVGKGGSGTTTKTESDYEQWLKNYTNDIAKADASLKLNNTTEDDYNKNRLSQIKSAQEELALMKPKNDAEAKLIEAKKQSLAGERQYYEQLTQGVTVTAKKFDAEAYAKAGSGTRDTTFDYKMTGNEKVIAQLEFDKSKAEAQLEELKKQAEDGCVEALDKLNAAEANVTSLEDALKLQKVKQDVQDLQKSLNAGTFSAIQTTWQGIEGTVSNISSLVDTMNDPDASGWEKFVSVISTAMGLIQTFTGIYEAFNTIHEIGIALGLAKAEQQTLENSQNIAGAASLTEMAAAESTLAVATPIATGMLTAQTTALTTGAIATNIDSTGTTQLAAAETALAVATPIATGGLIAQAVSAGATGIADAAAAAGVHALAAAFEVEAAAAIFAAHASIPFVGPALAAGFVATMEGVLAGVKATATATQALSTGGVVGGSSPNGDFVNARLNSGELVLDRTQTASMFRLINSASNTTAGMSGNFTMKVKGRDLVGCTANETKIASKSGKRTGIKI